MTTLVLCLTMWVSTGTFCLGFTAKKMGYLRWSDLGIIPFGPLWIVTPFWWDEDGLRMWTRRRLIFGWRWHFRMIRCGQALLKLAHNHETPRWLHDAIERFVYGKNGQQ